MACQMSHEILDDTDCENEAGSVFYLHLSLSRHIMIYTGPCLFHWPVEPRSEPGVWSLDRARRQPSQQQAGPQALIARKG